MSERLSDEQVARIIAWSQRDPSFTQRLALAREVQDMRRLARDLTALSEPVWLSTQGEGARLWQQLREAVPGE